MAPAAAPCAPRPTFCSSDTVLILSGDHPLVSAEIIGELIATYRDTDAAATVMTTEMDDPGSYGRIVRGAEGEIERIAEAAKTPGDATPEELAVIAEQGTPDLRLRRRWGLAEALERLTNDNAQGEYYLGDVLPMLRESTPRLPRLPRPRSGSEPRDQRSRRPA